MSDDPQYELARLVHETVRMLQRVSGWGSSTGIGGPQERRMLIDMAARSEKLMEQLEARAQIPDPSRPRKLNL